MANEDELRAWAAGEDVEGAKRGRGLSGLGAEWWAVQTLIVGGGSIYLAFLGSPWWLLPGLPVAAWLLRKAVHESRRQETWERLSRDDRR